MYLYVCIGVLMRCFTKSSVKGETFRSEALCFEGETLWGQNDLQLRCFRLILIEAYVKLSATHIVLGIDVVCMDVNSNRCLC